MQLLSKKTVLMVHAHNFMQRTESFVDIKFPILC